MGLPGHLALASVRLAELEELSGDVRRWPERLRSAEREVVGTPFEKLLLLLRLGPERNGGRLAEEVLDVMRSYAQDTLQLNVPLEQQLAILLMNQAEQLPGDLRSELLDGTNRLRIKPIVRARLLASEGRASEALELLRRKLPKDTTHSEQLRTAGLLMALLDEQAHDERLQVCDVVERLLVGEDDDPSMRSDLAAALWKSARGERKVLDRAWRHAEHAAEVLASSASAREVNARVLASIRMSQLASGAAMSTPEQIALALWFEQALPLPEEELDRHRREAASILLHPGPLTLPRALTIAERLLCGATDSAETQAIQSRLRWVRQRSQAASDTASPDSMGDRRGPFDEVPAWVVELAQGRPPSKAISFDEQELTFLPHLMTARPDRAEECLDWLLEIMLRASMTGRELLALLAALGPVGAVGPRLLERVERAVAREPSFSLLRLRVQLLAQTRAWGEETPYSHAANALLAAARTPEERLEAGFFKGVERLNALQVLHPLEGRREHILEEARQILLKAMEEITRVQIPDPLLFALLITTGNAFREGPAPEVERALGLYEQARSLGAPNPLEAARLSKVTADALLLRLAPGDAVQALRLLEHALKLREGGPYEAETLVSAAQAELEQPERPDEERLTRAIARLEEALRCGDERNRLALADQLISLMAQLIPHRRRDGSLHRRLDELGRLHPRLAEKAARAKRGQKGPVPEEWMRIGVASVQQPAVAAYVRETHPLKRAKDLIAELSLDPSSPLAQAILAQESPPEERTPSSLRARAERLLHVTDAEERPGLCAARAKLLTHLAGLGHASVQETLSTIEEAERLSRAISSPEARHFLILELVRVWTPLDVHDHPIADFSRAARLCREVLDDPAVSPAVSLDALQCFARATRYRTDGDRDAHLREAAKLYEECLRHYEHLGMEDGEAIMRTNLAEVRAELRTGGSEPEYDEGLKAARARVSVARGSSEQVLAKGNLAVELTRLGSRRRSPEGDALLAEARTHFESMPWEDVPELRRFSVENFQALCLAEIAVRAGRRAEAIGLWSQRLEGQDREAQPFNWAMTAHNFALHLMAPDRHTGSMETKAVIAGLLLCEQVLQIRTLEAHPGFHWETTDEMGQAIVRVLECRPDSDPWPHELWVRGAQALDSAIAAARRWGKGERLAQSALGLLRLSLLTQEPRHIEPTAERAWVALDEARPFLLVDEASAFEEAQVTADVGTVLARALNEQSASGSAGLSFVLTGDSAERVLRWLARASGAFQRTLAGRMSRPARVPSGDWVEWLEALRGGTPGGVARALEKVRLTEPSFLRGEPDLSGTWNWLRSRPGSAAVALVSGSLGTMVVALESPEQPRVMVAELRVDAIPVEERAVAQAMGVDEGGQPYRDLLAWARTHLLPSLQFLLPPAPTHLLWIPAGPLRLLAPVDLWPSTPVSLGTRLALEARPFPERPRCTLIAVADPGPGRRGDLKSAVKLGAHLAQRVAASGKPRALLSQGSKFGTALKLTCPGIVERPASAQDVLRELAEADVVVILCHGGVEGPRKATLQLLDETGSDSELALEQVGADPRRIAGATVVLLSCETGQVGSWLHRAAGLAGAFLASGARRIIAPLWDVRLGTAFQVGNAVLDALAGDQDPSLALHALQSADQQADRSSASSFGRIWSLKAFVHWVG
ncbi:CHAT domain-containing protein [Corallococcus soli]